MADEKNDAPAREPETESAEHVEDEAPTEDQEGTATETQVSDLATVEILADELQELRRKAAERDDYLDRLTRSKADFINYQKRTQRDRERWNETAVEGISLRVLPAFDDLQRALQAAEQDHDLGTLLAGLRLIQAKLLKALADEGITPIGTHGKTFDPAFHEAVANLHNPDVPHGTVLEELRRGFLLGPRVLRAAQVVIASGGRRPEIPPPLPSTTPEEETADVPPTGADGRENQD